MAIWDGNINDKTNFITDNYLEINSCGYQNTLPDYTVVRRNGRMDYHILLINNGQCKVYHNGKSYRLTKGNLVVYAPFEKQEYSFKSKSSTLWCHFSGHIVEELLKSCNISSGVYFLSPNKSILDSYTRLIQQFSLPNKKQFANVALLELIYNISDAINSSTEQKTTSDIILPILAYINANYNKQISLDELANKSGYSKSRFSHIFSETVGSSPIKYQNDIRLKNACEMLTSSNLSIAEISRICGFSDPLYFSRIFKRKHNTSPTHYRLND